MLNYFNFRKFRDKYLITNDLGRYCFVNEQDLKKMVSDRVEKCSDEVKDGLIQNYFWSDCSSQAFTERCSEGILESKNHLLNATSLHIFVLTDTCNLRCVYCQAQKEDRLQKNMMDFETAEKAVEFALQSPEKCMTFEFQGGEPLLNFEVIRHIVNYTNERKQDKTVYFSIVSNLTLLNQEMMDFIFANSIQISTSLDGNQDVHDHNRSFLNGQGSYEMVLQKIRLLRDRGINAGAIETTTKYSLSYPEKIIDAYIENGFDMIFLRPLTPLGCAAAEWDKIGYSPDEFVAFYKRCLDYLIRKNLDGYRISEGCAGIFLKKILGKSSVNYMDLRSPCGAALGQLAYYYNGDIYTCDEGRMLAEMGNSAFRLGNVFKDDYNKIMDSGVTRTMCRASCIESIPECSQCVYEPYCGVCPVVNLALYGDIIAKQPNNYRCRIYSGILQYLFNILYEGDASKIEILFQWQKNNE